MTLIGSVPRRSVNLPPGSLRTLIGCALTGRIQDGPHLEQFYDAFGTWLGVPHVVGAATGRSAFQLALESLDLSPGTEIVFPAFTFPVMPMVAKMLGLKPVFCDVAPETFNAGPEHVERVLTKQTGAILATHLFGRPCPIAELAQMAQSNGIRLLEDCAHGLGVRVGGKQVGTFGDMGVFSFAQGKNMPCFGGGAIATADDAIAERARAILNDAPIPSSSTLAKEAFGIWVKWVLTRPLLFGLTAYQALKLKLYMGKPLMDSAVGDELLDKFKDSNPRVARLANLQAAVGLKQLKQIDAFNAGARRNGEILTQSIGDAPDLQAPPSDGEHIYVYYPLRVDPEKRDDLRHYLLRHGIDTKTTDMSDCSALRQFRGTDDESVVPTDRSVLEICVYPSISQNVMRRIGEVIRAWADRPKVRTLDGTPGSSKTRATA